MDEKIMIAASELVETVEKYLKQAVSRSILCLKLAALKEALQQEQPEVDEDFFFDEVLKVYDYNNKYPPRSEEELTMLETIARHFYELGSEELIKIKEL